MERGTSVAGRDQTSSIIFGGFLPASMLDWEGKISTVFFTAGCNFRCPFCHNPELVTELENLTPFEWEDLSSHLKSRKGWLDAVVIGGGEPTIHSELPFYLREIKKMGYPVKLDTNGSNPQMIEELINEGLVDFIAMDIKTGFNHYEDATSNFASVRLIKQTIEKILSSGLKHEFRTTVVPGLVDRHDVLAIAEEIKGADIYILQQFNPQKTLSKDFNFVEPYSSDTLYSWAKEASEIVPTRVRGA